MIDELCMFGQIVWGLCQFYLGTKAQLNAVLWHYSISESVCGFPHVENVTPCVGKYLGHNDCELHRSTMDGSTITVGENYLLAKDDAPEMAHVGFPIAYSQNTSSYVSLSA